MIRYNEVIERYLKIEKLKSIFVVLLVFYILLLLDGLVDEDLLYNLIVFRNLLEYYINLKFLEYFNIL